METLEIGEEPQIDRNAMESFFDANEPFYTTEVQDFDSNLPPSNHDSGINEYNNSSVEHICSSMKDNIQSIDTNRGKGARPSPVLADPEPGENLTMFDTGFMSTLHRAVSSTQEAPSPKNTFPPPPIDQKETCIQRLSELNTTLMKDHNRLIPCKLTSYFLFTDSDKTTAEYLSKTATGSGNQVAIGQMLHGAQQFIEMIEEFKRTLLAHCPPSPPSIGQNAEIEAKNLPLVDAITGQPTDGTKQGRIEARWNAFQSYFNKIQLLPFSTSPEVSEPHSPPQSTKIDLHVRIATSLHQSFLWLHPIQA